LTFHPLWRVGMHLAEHRFLNPPTLWVTGSSGTAFGHIIVPAINGPTPLAGLSRAACRHAGMALLASIHIPGRGHSGRFLSSFGCPPSWPQWKTGGWACIGTGSCLERAHPHGLSGKQAGGHASEPDPALSVPTLMASVEDRRAGIRMIVVGCHLSRNPPGGWGGTYLV